MSTAELDSRALRPKLSYAFIENMSDKQMNLSFQNRVGIFFMIFSAVVTTIMLWFVCLPIDHPFILFNFGLFTMGAGLSTNAWLFKAGIVITMLFYIYSALMLPTDEALAATNAAISEIVSQNKASNMFQLIRQKFL